METSFCSPFIFAGVGAMAYLLKRLYQYIDFKISELIKAYHLKILIKKLKDDLFRYKCDKIYRFNLNYFSVFYDKKTAKYHAAMFLEWLSRKNLINEKYRLIEEFRI